jgi:hypothetical protein
LHRRQCCFVEQQFRYISLVERTNHTVYHSKRKW